MYTICRRRMIVISIRSSAELVPKKHIGLFTGYESAHAFLSSIKVLSRTSDIFH
jgi:hypothetical protein